jgi:hypothetical protein
MIIVLVIWKNMFLIQHLVEYKKLRLLVQGEIMIKWNMTKKCEMGHILNFDFKFHY